MKYIINLTIVFDLDNRRLSLYNDERIFIELTKPATRLLIELIKNNRINNSREELLNNVWVDYGFTASNAGLNNYISELRKSFTTLEMNREVIITIPKVGFRMDADIQSILATHGREILDEQPPQEDPDNVLAKIDQPSAKHEEDVQEDLAQQTRQPEPAPLYRHFPQAKITRIPPKFVVLLLLMSLLLIIALVIVKNGETKAQLVPLYRDGECHVSTLSANKGKGDMVNTARSYISRLNLDCHNTKYDILYTEQRPGVSIKNRVFIVACVKSDDDDNEYSSCSNYKYNQVTMK
ncbi:transcriptional regulator [Serratia sp. NPDC078593]|uniref:winged helix-turn-helix domain-containing protein n=1 Tax=unclassified Serratia (in: enterobacteria) TaxID=2647522 RepID=UPI0037CFB5FE